VERKGEEMRGETGTRYRCMYDVDEEREEEIETREFDFEIG